jgi:hypothetical protein
MKFTLLVVMLTLIIIAISKPDDNDCPRGSTVAAGIGLCK